MAIQDIFVPSSSGKDLMQPQTGHDALFMSVNDLPEFLTVEPPAAPVDPLTLVDYAIVRRLDFPFFVEKMYALNKDLAERLATLSKTGNPRCRLCNGSGVNGWRNAGRTAKVCKCVRAGAETDAVLKELEAA